MRLSDRLYGWRNDLVEQIFGCAPIRSGLVNLTLDLNEAKFGHPLISFDHLKLFSRCLHLCLTSDIQISLSASLPREPYSVCMILLKHHEVGLHVLRRRYRSVGGLTL